MKIKCAIKTLCKELKDPDYFIAWQANIAMQFVDENRRQGSRDSFAKVHDVANIAAKNFLHLLMRQPKKAVREK